VRLFVAALSALALAGCALGCSYDYEGARRCNNGVRDGDEIEADCGGSCERCGLRLTRRWQELALTPQPSARYGTVLVSQSRDQEPSSLLLFGGYAPGSLGDTWTLQGETWLNPTPPSQPPARHYAMAGYDPIGKRSVLAGSQDLKDSWMWNGSNWSQLDNLYGLRDAGGMVWDEDLDKLLLFAAKSTPS
jgi:hypothetical protein